MLSLYVQYSPVVVDIVLFDFPVSQTVIRTSYGTSRTAMLQRMLSVHGSAICCILSKDNKCI